MSRTAVTWFCRGRTLRAAITIALLAGATVLARTQPAKTVTLYIGFGPGGGYDFYGRATGCISLPPARAVCHPR